MLEDDVLGEQKNMKLSTGSKDDYKNSIGSKGSAGSKNSKDSFKKEHSKIVSNLKETSSTSSASTMNPIRKQPPAFLKCKSKTIFNKKLFQNGLKKESFQFYKKLGEGKFGKVFLVKEKNTGFILAMKVVQKRKIIDDGLLEQFIR